MFCELWSSRERGGLLVELDRVCHEFALASVGVGDCRDVAIFSQLPIMAEFEAALHGGPLAIKRP